MIGWGLRSQAEVYRYYRTALRAPGVMNLKLPHMQSTTGRAPFSKI